MNEIRCFYCSKLLAKKQGSNDTIEIKCCLSSQRYNFLKANHNSKQLTLIIMVLFIKSKIHFFESKSQPCKLKYSDKRRLYKSGQSQF